MRIFNILSALAKRKNTYVSTYQTLDMLTSQGTLPVASIQVTEPGVYLVMTMTSSSIGDADLLLITSMTTTGTWITRNYTARGTMNSGGGLTGVGLMNLKAGDTITGYAYHGAGWPAWTAQMSLFAIKLVGGVISTLRRAVIA